jgi:hypothetical protein
MEHNKASGLDGFSAEFYQNFLEIIKMDLLELFIALHAIQLELVRLNLGQIILLPKVIKSEGIQQYRPMCLVNVCFKIFKKIVTIRISLIAGHVVHPTQLLLCKEEIS